MILDDMRSYGKKEDRHEKKRAIPRERSSHGKKAREEKNFEIVQEEKYFANSFWKPAERPGWLSSKKFGVTLLILGVIFLFTISLINLIVLELSGALFLGGLLVVMLFMINVKIPISRLLFSRRHQHEVKELEINNNYEYSFESHKDVLFIRNGQNIIVVGLFRVKGVPITLVGILERFVRSNFELQLPLIWIHRQEPVPPDEVLEFPAITEDKRNEFESMLPHELTRELEKHGGIWNERIIFGSYRSLPLNRDSESRRELLRNQVLADLAEIRSAFRQTYSHVILEPLRGKDLITGYQLSIQGGAPASFYVTGYEAVNQFLQIPQIVAKSMDSHFPVECITPTRVPHDVRLGKAFSTEFHKVEVPAGLISGDMSKGVLVTGGTLQQRFTTNTKLVHSAAERGINYLIITNNAEWCKMLDLIPSACFLRLGEELILNPLDPDESELVEYSHLLMQVFAQCFPLPAHSCQQLAGLITQCFVQEGIPDMEILASKILDLTTIPRPGPTRELLGAVYNFLNNFHVGKVSRMLGGTNIPIKKLVRGINIVEIDIKNQKYQQFLILCFLAKVLSYNHGDPDHKLMVLVDTGDLLVPLDPLTQTARDAEQYLLDWVRRFRDQEVGLHLSIQAPSRFSKGILNAFQNVIAHRTKPDEDVQKLRDLLQLLPNHVVLSQGVRHDNWNSQYLKTLPDGFVFLKRHDIDHGFPVRIAALDLTWTHLWSSEEIEARLRKFFPGWLPPAPDKRPLLLRDFERDIKVVDDLLSLLDEYNRLGMTSLLSSLNSNPEIDIDRPYLQQLLYRLIHYGYIKPHTRDDGRGHQYNSFEILDKGRELHMNYISWVVERLRTTSSSQERGTS